MIKAIFYSKFDTQEGMMQLDLYDLGVMIADS